MPNLDNIKSDELDNFAQINKVQKRKIKSKTINLRISEDENKMLGALRSSPYNINIASFLRASIRHLYKKKIIEKIQTQENVENNPPEVKEENLNG